VRVFRVGAYGNHVGMEQAYSFLGVIAAWVGLSVAAWWLHRLYIHRKQRRRLALANEAWMRVREAPEIFADIRAAGGASGGADVQARTYALLNRVRDYGDYFDDVSALRSELARALGRDDCPPLTEILNIRRDIWAAADVLIIDDPAVFGDAFDEPGSYAAFCEEAEDLLFLEGPPLPDDPMVLRVQMADEDMQTFVSGVEGEIADERERERLPTLREIIAYPVAWMRAVPRLLAALWQGLGRLGQFVARAVGVLAGFGAEAARSIWALLRLLPRAIAAGAGAFQAGVTRLPALARRPGAALLSAGRGTSRVLARVPRYMRAALSGLAGIRRHPLAAQAAAAMRRASDRFPGQVSHGFARATEMARDVRDRARRATMSAREQARGFEAGELGLHYDFLIKAHGLRQRYAEVLRRAPELSETGRQFIARLELEKRSERLRLGTAKLRRRARLELVRILSVTIAALERLRDRLADVPAPAPQDAARLMSPLPRLFLPPPSGREAGAHFPGGLRAQARSWARGWSRPAQRMRDVPGDAADAEAEPDEADASPREPPETDTAAATGRYGTSRTTSGVAEPHEDAADKSSGDPAARAAQRVRRLFGIRDRKSARRDNVHARQTKAGTANGAEAPKRDRAREPGAAQAKNNSASPATEETRADGAADAQILPPLRGSRAGNYDRSETDPRAPGSLRSRLSGLDGHDDDVTGDADGPDSRDQAAHESGAAQHAGERRGWRRWFGLGGTGG